MAVEPGGGVAVGPGGGGGGKEPVHCISTNTVAYFYRSATRSSYAAPIFMALTDAGRLEGTMVIQLICTNVRGVLLRCLVLLGKASGSASVERCEQSAS